MSSKYPARTQAGTGAVCGVASATTVQYTDRTAFQTAAGVATTLETFEDEALGILTLPAAMAGSGLVVDVDSAGITAEITNAGGFGYNTTPGGENYLLFTGRGTYVASFGAPMNAFGFDISGFQDTEGDNGFAAELLLAGSTVETLFISDPGDFGPNFHGLVSDQAFDTVAFTFVPFTDGVADYVGFDDIEFAVVPEPCTLALLGLGVLGAVRRRRRS